MKVLHVFIIALVFAAALQPGAPALAYPDPDTSFMLFQLLLGGLAGGFTVA